MPNIPAARDSALAVPTLPHSPPVDLGAAGAMIPAAPAGAPFLLAGSNALLHASGPGVGDAWCAGRHTLSALRVDGATAIETEASRIALTRRLRLPAGEVIETLFVPGGASAVIVEWRALVESALELSWRGMPGASPDHETLRWNHGERGVIAAIDGARAAWLLTAASAPELTVSAVGGALECRARVRLEPGECCRLVCLAAPSEGALAANLAPLREPQSLVLARVGEQRRRSRTELTIQSDDAAFDESVLWTMQRVDAHVRAARQQLRTSAGASSPYDAESLVWLVLARTATGNDEAALELVDSMSEDAGRACASDPTANAQARAAYALLTVETCAWTGSMSAARRAWPTILGMLPAIESDIAAAADPCTAVLLAAALARLPHLPELLGDAAGAKQAQRLGVRARPRGLGAAQATGADAAAWAIALRLAEVDAAAAAGREYADSALTAWAELVAGRSAGWPRLARVLAAGGAPQAAGGDALRSALALQAVTSGLLGIYPDVPSSRLTLRPNLPVEWGSVRVGNIRLADWIVGMNYTRNGREHRFDLAPGEGSTPLTVIFEPRIPGQRLVTAEVDGTAAELDSAASGDRLRVSVQIVLDHPRTIRFVSE